MNEITKGRRRDRLWGWILAVFFVIAGLNFIWTGAHGRAFYDGKHDFLHTAKETVAIGIVFVCGGAYWFWGLAKSREKDTKKDEQGIGG